MLVKLIRHLKKVITHVLLNECRLVDIRFSSWSAFPMSSVGLRAARHDHISSLVCWKDMTLVPSQ